MGEQESLVRKELKTPRAAAIAGMVFSVLLVTSQMLVWISVPINLLEHRSAGAF